MKISLIVVFALLVVSCGQKFNPEITVADIKNNIEYLASDSLKGRKAGEEGDLLAAQFIREKFENAGLELKTGDFITAIEGKRVGNIYDYINHLQTLEAGTTVSGDIVRDNKETVIIIQL